MSRRIILFAFAPLAACISPAQGGAATSLSDDQAEPVLALFDHVLTGHFAAAGASGPRTCVSFLPKPLTAPQERQLLERFVRLSAATECKDGDAVIQVYEFSCKNEASCIGWVSRPGSPAARYAMQYRDGTWRFTRDIRAIGE